MKNPILGPTAIPQFNDKPQKINLSDYEQDIAPEIEGFEFMYIMSWDISHLTMLSPEYLALRQYAIRYSDASPEAQQEMQDSYTRNDWDTSKGFPPQWTLNENDEPDIEGAINGRRRVGGAIEMRQPNIPLAIYRKKEGITDKYAKQCRLENAQILNDQESSVRYNGMKDYAQTGIELIKGKHIKSDMNSILTWLETRMNYKRRFPYPPNQVYIANRIFELGNADYMLTKEMSEPLAHAWVKDAGILKKIDGKWDTSIRVVCVDDIRYTDRLIADFVIPSVLEKIRTDPVNIILYSKKRKPADVKKNIKRFGEALNTSYDNIFKFVEVMMNNVLVVNIPEYKPYQIMGCIPQLQEEQDVDGIKLIPYDVVTKGVTLKSISKVLKIAA